MFVAGSPVAISNLYYERASILLNLACLFSQLGTSEDRVSEEGIKRAVAHFTVCDTVLLLGALKVVVLKSPLSDQERSRDYLVLVSERHLTTSKVLGECWPPSAP